MTDPAVPIFSNALRFVREGNKLLANTGLTLFFNDDLQAIEALERLQQPAMFSDIRRFHEKFGQKYDGPPRYLPAEIADFRVGFVMEEADEYLEAVDEQDREKQLDALVDLVYVALGNAYLQGFDFAEAWRRVHAKNMAKQRAKADGSDSKRGNAYDIVKPPGWTPPILDDLAYTAAEREARNPQPSPADLKIYADEFAQLSEQNEAGAVELEQLALEGLGQVQLEGEPADDLVIGDGHLEGVVINDHGTFISSEDTLLPVDEATVPPSTEQVDTVKEG